MDWIVTESSHLQNNRIDLAVSIIIIVVFVVFGITVLQCQTAGRDGRWTASLPA